MEGEGSSGIKRVNPYEVSHCDAGRWIAGRGEKWDQDQN